MMSAAIYCVSTPRGESCCTVPVVPGENCEDDC
jgi:hypothetical protein